MIDSKLVLFVWFDFLVYICCLAELEKLRGLIWRCWWRAAQFFIFDFGFFGRVFQLDFCCDQSVWIEASADITITLLEILD